MSSLSYFLAYNSLESREFHQNSLKPTKYLQYFLNANFVTINGTSYIGQKIMRTIALCCLVFLYMDMFY